MQKEKFARSLSFVLLVVAFFIGFFNRFAPATFAAPIGQSLGLGAAALGSLAAMHFWVYTLMQVPAGLVVDRLGIRLPAMVGTLLTGAGAIALGVAESYVVALSGPFLVGLGMSLVFVTVMKNNAIWFDGRQFGTITGVTLLIGTVGSLAAEAPAGLLLAWVDWRTIFISLGVATLVIALLILFFWQPPSEVSDGARPLHQHGLRRPGLWKGVVGSRQLWLILLAIAGTNGTFYAFAGLWGTPLLTDGYGLSNTAASLILTLSWVPYGVGSLLFGQWSDCIQSRRHFIWISSLLNIAAWLWLVWGPVSGFTGGLVCFLLLGLTGGAQVAVSFAAVKESVHAEITGSAIAFVNMGVFLVTAIIQTAYGWVVSLAAPDALAAIYREALWLPASLSLAGLVAALWVKETYSDEEAGDKTGIGQGVSLQ